MQNVSVGLPLGIYSKINTKTDVNLNKDISSAKSVNQKEDTDYFEKYSNKHLPEGKAILVERKTSDRSKILNGLGAFLTLGNAVPIWFFKTGNEIDLKLVDIDKNNLTKEQIDLIKNGKLIDFLPRGYEIKDGNVVKM